MTQFRRDRRNRSSFVKVFVAIVVAVVLAVAISVGVLVSQKKTSSPSISGETTRVGSAGSQRTSHEFDQNEFAQALEAKRREFSDLYGGDKASSDLLLSNIISYSDRELGRTAERILAARAANRPFVIASAGYSVTTGRGNLHEQSFPFEVANVVREPFELLGVTIETRNAGLGGVNSLPYGWCLKNFLGADADVISWDFRFNEGSDSVSFESFMRHSMVMPNAPKFILMARKSASRKGILKEYVQTGWQVDPIVMDNSYPPENGFLSLDKEEDRPPGWQNFDDYGAPAGSPGQSPWNPTYQWHSMMAWIMGIYILQAADIAGQLIESGEGDITYPPPSGLLPSPTNDADHCETSSEASLLFGQPVIGKNDVKWFMPSTYCSTTFTPTVDGTGLTEFIVSGLTGEGDITEDTTDLMGWTLGFGSASTREEHVQYSAYGFRDAKKSLHGFHTSGPLTLWIPWIDDGDASGATIQRRSLRNIDDYRATSWYKTLVVCSFYEKADQRLCNLKTDTEFLVGGQVATDVNFLEAVGTKWMNKQLCVAIEVPSDAKTSTREQAGADSESGLKTSEDIGVVLSITVTNTNLVASGSACSISHVVWQHASE